MEFVKVLVVLSAILKMSSGIFTAEQTSEIDKFVQEVMACKQIPGLSLAVVKGNKTWTKGYGYEDTEKGIKVSSDTLFGIGSTTKSFTSILLGMLMEDSNGRITWNTKVKDVLGSDFAFVDDERTRDTTIRDLLTHRTGLSTVIVPMLAGFNRTYSRKELAKRFRFLPEVHAFRDVYDYNNWGYALAGYVVEMLSGESWEDTLEKRILRPLGMTKSRVLGKTVQSSDIGVAKPYHLIGSEMILTDPTIYDIHPFEAAGAIASSANDMAKWIRFLLREGKTADNRQLITSQTLKETFKVHQSPSDLMITAMSIFRPQFPVSDIVYGYGYGWAISTYRGFRKTYHPGSLHSYKTNLHFYSGEDVGMFSTVNGPGTSDAVIAERMILFFITDLLLGEKPWLDASTACTFPSPFSNVTYGAPANSGITEATVGCADCYVGKYGHYLFGDIEVKVNETSGLLELHYSKFRGTLNWTGKGAVFKLDVDGVYKLVSHPGNDTELVDITFDKLQTGSYQLLEMYFPTKMAFTRGISFHDTDIFKSTTITGKPIPSGQGRAQKDQHVVALVLLLAFVLL